MYKNIIFDLGGVIVKFNPRNFLMEKFLNDKTETKVYNIVFGSETWKDMDSGLLSREKGTEIMLQDAKEQDCLFEVQEVLDTWLNILEPRMYIVKLAALLKQSGYNIFYLSNMPNDVFDYLSSHAFFPAFDGGVCSYEIGINKPDERIYTALLKKYELKADESIFIDDTLANVKAACDLDITGIHMRGNASSLKKHLKICGITLD